MWLLSSVKYYLHTLAQSQHFRVQMMEIPSVFAIFDLDNRLVIEPMNDSIVHEFRKQR